MTNQTEQRNEVSAAYASMIGEAIESTVKRRIIEIEGDAPNKEKMKKHGEREVSPNGIVRYFWKGEPIAEFEPAGFREDGGWRDAVLSEVRALSEMAVK